MSNEFCVGMIWGIVLFVAILVTLKTFTSNFECKLIVKDESEYNTSK